MNSNAFVKPEAEKEKSGDEVFNHFVSKFGNVSTFDDALEKIQGRIWSFSAKIQKNTKGFIIFMRKIIVNKIRCKRCGDVIESKSVHDFKFCKCEAVAVDGGHDYLRRLGETEDWEDLSKYDFSSLFR